MKWRTGAERSAKLCVHEDTAAHGGGEENVMMAWVVRLLKIMF